MKKVVILGVLVLLSQLSFVLKAQQWNVFETNYGYIKMGPANNNYAQIVTNGPKFYFNRDIYVPKGGAISSINGALYLKTQGTIRMMLKNDGNVGIGTTNPLETLHVNGNLLIPSDHSLKLGTENANSGHLTIHNGSSDYNTFADIKGNLYFRTEDSLGALGIQKDGSVVVGIDPKSDSSITDTDGHQLMVNGGILCEKVKVIGEVPNSDHVFEEEYDLKTIAEVKSFIETNKHLPEIPSAKEFKEQGYSVGEMDDLLLRKVEELTLYIIQHQAEIDRLKSENKELREIISK